MTKSSLSEDRIIVGKIGKTHGIGGFFRVNILTDFPERFKNMKEITAGDKVYKIDGVREHNNGILMKFENINTPEDAKLLNGKLLTVSKAEAAPLNEGEYYVFDIIGLTVSDTKGEVLGEVKNILQTGSNDVYEVKDGDGREILIPALKKVVKEIDIENKKMTVDLAEMEMLDAV